MRHDRVLAEYESRGYLSRRTLHEELREGGTACGRSFSNFLICAQGGEELLGKTHRVRVEKTARMALYGKVIA